MRSFERSKLGSATLLLVFSPMATGLGYVSVRAAAVERVSQTQASTEGEAYAEWYQSVKNRELERIMELGNQYVGSYPNGKYAAFVKIYIDFAQASLDPVRRKDADTLRQQILGSLMESDRALLKGVLTNQLEVNTKGRNDTTALMVAAANGDSDSLKSVIEKHPDVDSKETTHGWTALIYAIWRGEESNIRYLLKQYPNVDIRDVEGRTALAHAKATGDFELMVLISSRPGKYYSN
jgi:hypothetical protein